MKLIQEQHKLSNTNLCSHTRSQKTTRFRPSKSIRRYLWTMIQHISPGYKGKFSKWRQSHLSNSQMIEVSRNAFPRFTYLTIRNTFKYLRITSITWPDDFQYYHDILYDRKLCTIWVDEEDETRTYETREEYTKSPFERLQRIHLGKFSGVKTWILIADKNKPLHEWWVLDNRRFMEVTWKKSKPRKVWDTWDGNTWGCLEKMVARRSRYLFKNLNPLSVPLAACHEKFVRTNGNLVCSCVPCPLASKVVHILTSLSHLWYTPELSLWQVMLSTMS